MAYFLVTLASLVMGLVFAPPLIAVAPVLFVGLVLIASPMLLHGLGLRHRMISGSSAPPRPSHIAELTVPD